MNGLEIVPGSERAYVLDDNGVPLNDADFGVRRSPELREEELERERRRLEPIIERGEAAEEKLAYKQLRRARSPAEREFGEADELTPDERALAAALASWRSRA